MDDMVTIPSSFLNSLDFPSYSWDGVLAQGDHCLHIDEDQVTDVLSVATQRVRVSATNKAGTPPYEELGRVSIVNKWGICVYDSLVQPDEGVVVVDTFHSQTGITKEGIRDEGTPIDTVVAQVETLIEGKRLVGHSVHDDVSILRIWGLDDLEDVQRIFRDRHPKDYPQLPGPSLDTLANRFLNGFTLPFPMSAILRAQVCLRLYLNHVQGIKLESWRPSGTCSVPKGKNKTKTMSKPCPSPIELPCGHTTTATVDETYTCPIIVQRKCSLGHVSQAPCNTNQEGVSFECQEEVSRKPSCVHEAPRVKCFEFKRKCEQLIQVKCSAGLHTQLVGCDDTKKGKKAGRCADCGMLSLLPRFLPCGHVLKSPSSRDAQECQEMVSVKCKAGIHELLRPCRQSGEELVCPSCHEDLEKIQISSFDLPVTPEIPIVLPCGHPIMTSDSSPGGSPSKCLILVEKGTPCGHINKVPCHMDPVAFRCAQPDPDKLFSTSKCFERSLDVQEGVTSAPTINILLPCGHALKDPSQKQLEASPDSIKCPVWVDKDCPCGHVNKVPCHKDPATWKCKNDHLQCGHAMSKAEQTPPGPFKCTVLLEKVSPCGHANKVPCHMDAAVFQCPCHDHGGGPCKNQKKKPLENRPFEGIVVATTGPVFKEDKIKVKCRAGLHDLLILRGQEGFQGNLFCSPCDAAVGTVPQGQGDLGVFTDSASSSTIPLSIPLPCGHILHNPSKKQQETPPESLKCSIFVEKETPCGHLNKVPCHLDPSSFKCDQPSPLSCPHMERSCFEVKEGLGTLCQETIKVKCRAGTHFLLRPCGQQVDLLCNFCTNASSGISLPCGHTITSPSLSVQRLTPEAIKCPAPVAKRCARPSCGREVNVPCHKSKTKTNLLCTPCTLALGLGIQLPCGHVLQNPSPRQKMDPRSAKCPEMVQKKGPCGHINNIPCHMNPLEFKCQHVVESFSSNCVHKTAFKSEAETIIRCHEMKMKVCSKPVQIKCRGGFHTLNIECNRVSNPPVCNELVTRTLDTCGHKIQVPCSQKKEPECKQIVGVKCVAGLHFQEVLCALKDLPPSGSCNAKVTKTLACCGRQLKVYCVQKNIFCDRCLFNSIPAPLGQNPPPQYAEGKKSSTTDAPKAPAPPTPQVKETQEELKGPLILPKAIITSFYPAKELGFIYTGLLSESPHWWDLDEE